MAETIEVEVGGLVNNIDENLRDSDIEENYLNYLRNQTEESVLEFYRQFERQQEQAEEQALEETDSEADGDEDGRMADLSDDL